MAEHLGDDVVDIAPLPAMEGVLGVAVAAAQRATGQAHEHGRPAGGVGLALQGQEDLGDLQPRQRRLHDFAGRGGGAGKGNDGHGGNFWRG